MDTIFIVAGEGSADTLGAGLLEALPPNLRVVGIGGPKMRATGMEVIFPMEKLQVMGFVDVALALPRLIFLFRKTVRAILKIQPNVVVTIDYPGFNLRLARCLRKKGFRGKICHYICPSVWAWGKKRIPLMEKNLDLLLSVLPFEKKYFTSLRVEYIGHPLVQQIVPNTAPPQPLIALFPGSRSHEIKKNLPYMVQLQQAFPGYDFVISCAHEKLRPLLQHQPIPVLSPTEMKKLHPVLAVAKSGTVTLELALQEIPTVVIYAISWLDTFIARHIFHIFLPYYALPNLIAQKLIFPELIGPALNLESLCREVKSLLENPSATIAACKTLKSQLGKENSNKRAAQLILTLLGR
jgi:lipid-A-disaccharide synthase